MTQIIGVFLTTIVILGGVISCQYVMTDAVLKKLKAALQRQRYRPPLHQSRCPLPMNR